MESKKKKATLQTSPKKLALPASKHQEIDYEVDFSAWATSQANFLKTGEFKKLDIDNLIEEIEDLSRRERDKLVSHLENLLMHKLKVKYQPTMHTASWDSSSRYLPGSREKILLS